MWGGRICNPDSGRAYSDPEELIDRLGYDGVVRETARSLHSWAKDSIYKADSWWIAEIDIEERVP